VSALVVPFTVATATLLRSALMDTTATILMPARLMGTTARRGLAAVSLSVPAPGIAVATTVIAAVGVTDTVADTAIAAASAMATEVATDTGAATALGTVAATAADIAEPQPVADTTAAVAVDSMVVVAEVDSMVVVAEVDSTVVVAVTVVVDTGNCSSVVL
jgi:hypothetical protein